MTRRKPSPQLPLPSSFEAPRAPRPASSGARGYPALALGLAALALGAGCDSVPTPAPVQAAIVRICDAAPHAAPRILPCPVPMAMAGAMPVAYVPPPPVIDVDAGVESRVERSTETE